MRSASSSSSCDGHQLRHRWSLVHFLLRPRQRGYLCVSYTCSRDLVTHCLLVLYNRHSPPTGSVRSKDQSDFYQSAEGWWGGWFSSPTWLTNWLTDWFPDSLVSVFACVSVCGQKLRSYIASSGCIFLFISHSVVCCGRKFSSAHPDCKMNIMKQLEDGSFNCQTSVGTHIGLAL